MEFLLSFGIVGAAAICVLIPGLLLAIVVGIYMAKKSIGSSRGRQNLLITGVTNPAIILSARNDSASSSGRQSNINTAHVTFEVEVQPADEAPFQATFKDALPIRQGEKFEYGERAGEAGTKIWVTYDPNDKKRMILDHYDSDHKFAMKRKAFDKREKIYETLRRTGVAAVAEILEVEDLQIANKVEKDFIGQTMMRLKLSVSLKGDAPYQAETQGAFQSSGLHKYVVGKKVNVRVDPADKQQVALIGSAQE